MASATQAATSQERLPIQFDTLYRLVRDVLSELVRNRFTRIMVLSGHAGSSHMVALRLAAQEVVTKNDSPSGQRVRVMVLSDFDFAEDIAAEYAPPGDGHAGAIETSRVMAIKPEYIKAKGTASHSKMPRFEVVAHPELYFSGVNGDPTAATPQKGVKINEYIVEQVAKLVQELQQ